MMMEREYDDRDAQRHGEESDIERREEFDAVQPQAPYPPRERGTAVYGETDIDPNREDQRSAHQAESDEHV